MKWSTSQRVTRPAKRISKRSSKMAKRVAERSTRLTNRMTGQSDPGFFSGKRAGLAALVVGAAGALAAGLALVRRRGGLRDAAEDLREGVQRAADRVSPKRHRRDVATLRVLTKLEDDVIDAFLEDEVLSNRGIDVGAVAEGIIELSGSVQEEGEAEKAVRVAQAVAGVNTVVNRLGMVPPVPRRSGFASTGGDGQWNGRNVGMGRMRQDPATEPDRRDDSQKLRDRALAEADRNDAMSVDPDRMDEENSIGANQAAGRRLDEE